ncbi:MAG: DUF5667 domain-containing protein, partial [Candidatus Paceibacterales bacterium]
MSLDNVDNFLKKSKAVTLDENKKAAIGQEILRFMKANPIQERKGLLSRVYALPIFSYRPLAITLASLLLCVLVGGVASASATAALPGDLLYPVKVGFNEKIMQALAFSQKDKLQVSINLAQTRLQETEKLMVSNKLTSQNEAQLEVGFKDQADNAAHSLKNISRDSGADASSDFTALLKAHASVLQDIGSEN